MRFDIITIFPEFFGGPLDYGIVRRARESRLIEACIHDLRDFAHDRHRTVDDRPFGGGEGMVMKPEPLFEAVETLVFGGYEKGSTPAPELKRIVLLCGRYEGVDERVAEHLATDEISIGDFVLSGGELPAAMIVDAVTRLIPGALGNEDSALNESFSEPAGADGVPTTTSQPLRATSRGILDYPHYTRPQSFRGWDVPEVMIGGNHEEIRRWRRQKALEKTLRNRPDLLEGISAGRDR